MTSDKHNNTTLYILPKSQPIVKRAKKLLDFYEDKSLSQAFIEMCEKVVIKYDKGKKL